LRDKLALLGLKFMKTIKDNQARWFGDRVILFPSLHHKDINFTVKHFRSHLNVCVKKLNISISFKSLNDTNFY